MRRLRRAAIRSVALRTDPGIRSILESTAAYGRNVTYAAVVDNEGHRHRAQLSRGRRPEARAGENLAAVLDGDTLTQIRAIYADRSLEVVLPLQLGDSPFGAIRVGLSPVLIRNDLTQARPADVVDDRRLSRARRSARDGPRRR